MTVPGLVTLVGAGPGDPELVTLRGLRAIEEADVVVYDRLAAPELLSHARPGAELVGVGKRAGKHSVPQDEINAILVRKAKEGRRVARLKGGDPFIFGRGGEEMRVLAAEGIPVEVVPGVTAASGASAYCGMPLTERGLASSVTFVTGHEDPTKGRADVDWAALARTGGTVVVYMGIGRLEEIAAALVAGGLDPETPAALVRRATTPEQKSIAAPVSRIAEVARERGITPPALLIVGKVAGALGAGTPRSSWFESLPLFGRRIVVTRSRAQASSLVKALARLGADVMELPTIEIVPPADPGALDRALGEVEAYDYVIFTSANAVDSVRKRLFALGLDARSFSHTRIAAIGDATAAKLREFGLAADVVAEKFTAEGLLDALAPEDVDGKRVLLPRAREAREVLPEGLRARGATVDVVEAYRTVRPELAAGGERRALEALLAGEVDLVTFASSSTVRNLVELVELVKSAGPAGMESARNVPVASIGPITSGTARELGFTVVVEPEKHTIPALVEAIRVHFAQQR